jgi:hypothetical protein
VNGREEISSEFVVSGGNSPEILEPAEGSLDDVAAFVSPFVEAVEPDARRLVGNDGLGAEQGYASPEFISVIAAIGDERTHRRRERQYARPGGDVGVLAWCEMEGKRSAERIAQRMDLRRAPAA